jgi:hypothetical protein
MIYLSGVRESVGKRKRHPQRWEGCGRSLHQGNVEQKLVNERLIRGDTLRRGDSQHVLRVAPCCGEDALQGVAV